MREPSYNDLPKIPSGDLVYFVRHGLQPTTHKRTSKTKCTLGSCLPHAALDEMARRLKEASNTGTESEA